MAGETYKILDLDLDYSKLITSTTEARKRVSDLKTELAALKKEGKETTDEYTKLDAELRVTSNELRVNTKLLTDSAQAATGNTATIEQMRKALSVVSTQWAQLTEEEQKNSEQGVVLTAQKTELTAKLKQLESATGDNRRNVGNYTQSILEASKSMGVFGGTFGNAIGTLQSAKQGLEGVKAGFEASKGGATGFAGAMNVVKSAIAATGIGLLIIALGLLVSWLSKIDPVVDKAQQIFAGFGAAIDVVKSTILRFVDGIKSVGDLMGKLGSIIANPIDSFKQLAGSMAEAAVEAARLKEAQQDLADAQQVQEVMTARANQQIKELILQSKNRSTSERERQELLAKAAKLDQEEYDRRSRLAEEDLRINEAVIKTKADLNAQEIANLKQKGIEYAIELLNQGKLTDEDVEAYKKALLTKIAILDESTARQEKIQNQADALEEKRIAKAQAAAKAAEEAEKKRQAEAKKKQEAILQAMQEELDLQDALSGKNKTESQLAQRYQLELDLLNEQLAQKLISETKYQTELAKIQDEYMAASEERLNRIAAEAEAFAKAELENEKKAIEARIAVLNELNDYKNADRELARQAIITDYENELEIRRLQGESAYNLKLEQLDREKAAELKAAEQMGVQKNLIYQKYELAKQQITKEANRANLAIISDSLGKVSELLGKNTVAGKAAGIAQATINTYLGVSQVLAAPPSGPEPFNTITKAISIATTIATGIANVANIARVPTKFEAGGLAAGITGGRRHSSGGTKYYGEDGHVVELEAGENWYVLNRGASKAINSLSALNEHYGGVSFAAPVQTGFHADGGMVSRSLEIPDISPQIGAAVADALKEVKIYTDVKDVIREAGNRAALVDGANI